MKTNKFKSVNNFRLKEIKSKRCRKIKYKYHLEYRLRCMKYRMSWEAKKIFIRIIRTIPINMTPLKINDPLLVGYANLFIKRFASNFEKICKKFVVEIWHTKQIVGMFFKVVSLSEYNEPIIWKDKQQNISEIFKKIDELGKSETTYQQSTKKNIRGFSKEYFYIFRPNEKRLWHKVEGVLDVDEFMDAILRAGRDGND